MLTILSVHTDDSRGAGPVESSTHFTMRGPGATKDTKAPKSVLQHLEILLVGSPKTGLSFNDRKDREQKKRTAVVAVLILLGWTLCSVIFAIFYNRTPSSGKRIPEDLEKPPRACETNQSCLFAIGGAWSAVDHFLPVVEGFNGSNWGFEGMLPKGSDGKHGRGVSTSAVTLAGRLYIVGHTAHGDVHSTKVDEQVDEMNWVVEPALAYKRNGFAMVVYKERIYVIGGSHLCLVKSLEEDENSKCTQPGWTEPGEQAAAELSDIVESIDPVTESVWRTDCAKGGDEEGGVGHADLCLRIARTGLSAAVFQDSIFAIGGYEGTTVEVYNGTKWEELEAEFPYSVYAAAMAVFDSKLWVLGGFSYNSYLRNAMSWDGNIWSQGAKFKHSRAWPASAVFETCDETSGVCREKLYVLGGSNSLQALSEVEIYDSALTAWTEGPRLPNARNRLAAVVVYSSQSAQVGHGNG